MIMRAVWVACCLVWLLPAAAEGATVPVVDLVVVEKSRHRLSLFARGQLIKRYWVALGPQPRGPKQQAGDGRTPEGRYLLDYKKEDSRYHKAIHISYPGLRDLHQAWARGVDPGGAIWLHGQPDAGIRLQSSNWTNGCIALLNEDMDELWALIRPGTPIEIRP